VTQQDQYDSIIAEAASRYGVPFGLIKGTILIESSFNPRAYRAEPARSSLPPTSDFPNGGDASYGLMQLLSRTARGLGFTGALLELYDPETNIDLGTQLLAQNLRMTGGSVADTVSAYNGGFRPSLGYGEVGASGQYANQSYVDRVLAAMRAFGGEVEGMASSAVPFRPRPRPVAPAPAASRMKRLLARLWLWWHA